MCILIFVYYLSKPMKISSIQEPKYKHTCLQLLKMCTKINKYGWKKVSSYNKKTFMHFVIKRVKNILCIDLRNVYTYDNEILNRFNGAKITIINIKCYELAGTNVDNKYILKFLKISKKLVFNKLQIKISCSCDTFATNMCNSPDICNQSIKNLRGFIKQLSFDVHIKIFQGYTCAEYNRIFWENTKHCVFWSEFVIFNKINIKNCRHKSLKNRLIGHSILTSKWKEEEEYIMD